MADERGREPPETHYSSTGETFSSQQYALVTADKLTSVEFPLVSEQSELLPKHPHRKVSHFIVGLLPLGILAVTAVLWSFLGKIPIFNTSQTSTSRGRPPAFA